MTTTWTEYFEPPRERRLPSYLQWVTSWEEWLSFALLSAAVLAAVTSIVRADWVDGMTNLLLISFVGLVLGFLLGHVRVNGWALQPGVLVIGFIVLAWQILAVVPGVTWGDRWDTYWGRMGDWLGVANDGGISNDPLPFISIVSLATFLTSYIAAWSVFRWRNAWIALLPVGIILFINISFLPGEFDFALIVFLFCAFLLTVRMAMTRRQEQWEREDVEYPELISLTSLHDAAWVAAVLLVGAWLIPTANDIPVLDNTWDSAFSDSNAVNDTFERLFAGVDSKQEREIRDYDEFFSFRGNLDLSDRTLLRVGVANPTQVTLLRGATYEEYSPIGWHTQDRLEESVELQVEAESEPATVAEGLPAVSSIEQPGITIAEISNRAETDTLFTIGQPLGADVEADLLSTSQTSFLFDIQNPGLDRGLPDDIRAVSETIREAEQLNPLPLTNDEIAARIPDGLVVISLNRDGDGEVERLLVTRGRGFAYDTTGLEAPEALPDDSSYVSVGVVNRPTTDQLNAAGDDYPEWVADTYLQLPDELPQRIRDLAAVAAGVEETAFGKAVAVQNYLRGAYGETNYGVDRPPVGADGVDYFLFEVGADGAFFDYHASAMAVMLRSLGIPARLATGYYLNPANLEDERFRVRESDLFSWTDVYFPGIGWVEFNPSPDGPILYLTSVDLPGSSGSFFPESLDADDLPGLEGLLPGLPGIEDVPGERTDEAGGDADLAIEEGSGASFPTGILIAVLAVVGGIVFLGLAGNAVWQWGVRGLNYPAQVWEKTIRLANWTGIGVRPSDTPREFARKLSSGLPEVKGIEEMEAAYSRAQFGRKELTPDEQKRVKKVWGDIRGALTARLFRLRRPKS